MIDPDLESLNQTVQRLLDLTDKYLIKAFGKEIKANSKGGIQLSTDLVTEADLYIEKLLKTGLQKYFPEVGFLAEEGSETTIQDYNWIIDPVDGTANFANHLPIFGTSVTLWYMDKPVYAVNSFPMLRERVYARKGAGVFLNGKSVKPYGSPNKEKVMVTKAHVSSDTEKLEILKKLLTVVPSPINFQAASFHLTCQTLGRTDAAVILNLPIWDIASGELFMHEAGMSYQYIGKKPDLYESNIRDQRFCLIAARTEDLVTRIVNALSKKV